MTLETLATVGWWLAILALLAVDLSRERRLTPLIAILMLSGIVAPSNFDDLGADTRAWLAQTHRGLSYTVTLIFAWTGYRTLGGARAPGWAMWVGIATVLVAAWVSYEPFMWIHSTYGIVVAVAVIAGLFEAAYAGKRLPGGADVTLALFAVVDLVSHAIVIADSLGDYQLLSRVWLQVVFLNLGAVIAGFLAYFVPWPQVTARLG